MERGVELTGVAIQAGLLVGALTIIVLMWTYLQSVVVARVEQVSLFILGCAHGVSLFVVGSLLFLGFGVTQRLASSEGEAGSLAIMYLILAIPLLVVMSSMGVYFQVMFRPPPPRSVRVD